MNTEKHVRGVPPTLRFNKKLIRLIRKLKRRKYNFFSMSQIHMKPERNNIKNTNFKCM